MCICFVALESNWCVGAILGARQVHQLRAGALETELHWRGLRATPFKSSCPGKLDSTHSNFLPIYLHVPLPHD